MQNVYILKQGKKTIYAEIKEKSPILSFGVEFILWENKRYRYFKNKELLFDFKFNRKIHIILNGDDYRIDNS